MAAPYSFQAEPQATAGAGGGRKKYRSAPAEPQKEQFTATTAFGARSNIMADKRVRRGVTCPPKERAPAPVFIQQSSPAAAAPPAQRNASTVTQPLGPMAKLQEEEDRPLTPEPVAGRSHAGAQTHTYIEHLTAKPKTKNFSTQTDPAKDYPVPPLFQHRTWIAIPPAADETAAAAAAAAAGGAAPALDADGQPIHDPNSSRTDDAAPRIRFEPRIDSVDVWTLIEESPNGIFDYDVASDPVVHVLCEKTLELAMQEVCEEEEAKILARHASQFAQQRTVEFSEAQRVLAAEQRKLAEKERRLKQAVDDAAAKRLATEREIAKECTSEFLGQLQDGVIARLERDGRFYDPTLKQINDIFMPYTIQKVSQRLQVVATARRTVDALLHSVVATHTTAINEQHAAAAPDSYIGQVRAHGTAEDDARIATKPNHKPYVIPDRRHPPASEELRRKAAAAAAAAPNKPSPAASSS